jgi:hypothetical protein
MKKVSVVLSAIFIFNRANMKGDGRRKNISEEAQVYVHVAKNFLQLPSTANTCYHNLPFLFLSLSPLCGEDDSAACTGWP